MNKSGPYNLSAHTVSGIPGDAMKRVIQFQSALLELSKMSFEDFDSSLAKILETDALSMGVGRVSLWQYDDTRSGIVCSDLYILSEHKHDRGRRLDAKDYPIYFHSLENELTIAANDAQVDSRTREFTESYLKPLGIVSMLDVPVRLRGKTVGILCHEHCGKEREWTDDEKSFSSSLSEIVSLCLESRERRKAEEALEHSYSLLRATLDSTTDGILVVDRAEKITGLNKTFLKMWRIPDEVIQSKDDSRAIVFVLDQLKDPESFKKKIRKLYDRPEEESYDMLQFKDGRIFERYSQPQRLGDRIVGRVWSFRDVTERKTIEDALIKKSQELAQYNAELEEYAYVASHDLQEPLRSVASYLDLLKKKYDGNLDDEARRYISRAVNGAARMKALINDLLEYSRADKAPAEVTPVNSAEALKIALENLKAAIEESGAVIKWENLPTVRYAGPDLVTIFQNLLTNAVKFRSKETPVVMVDARKENGELIFSVMDDGIGIEPQYQERIFQAFQRLHARSKYDGTGIGLAITKKIVVRRGGRIWVESELGQGARFCFTIKEGES